MRIWVIENGLTFAAIHPEVSVYMCPIMLRVGQAASSLRDVQPSSAHGRHGPVQVKACHEQGCPARLAG